MEIHGKRQHRKTEDQVWRRFFDEDQKEEYKRQQLMEMSLADTGLSVRIVNNLENHGIEQVQQLVQHSREDLLAIENLGEQILQECGQAMDKLDVAHPDWSRPKKPGKKPKAKKKKAKAKSPAALFASGKETGRWSSERPNVANTSKRREKDYKRVLKKKRRRPVVDEDLNRYFGE